MPGWGLVFLGGLATYAYFSYRLPKLPDISRYEHEAAESTQVRAWDGTILADWATKRREVVPAKDVPPLLIQAFVAVEDRRFYEHGGLDYRGIMRAVLANLRAGEVSQGGSTITQQVARSFFDTELFFARSFLRKIPEAILARRLEARYSKEEILTLYLNQIFLGPDRLRRGRRRPALLRQDGERAGPGRDGHHRRHRPGAQPVLPHPQPGTGPGAGATRCWRRWSRPATSPRRRRRRSRPSRWCCARRPTSSASARPTSPSTCAATWPSKYGDKLLYEGGLEIETTVVPWIDLAAQENVDFSLRKLDKRQGWRGPVARVTGPGRRAVQAQDGRALRQRPAEGGAR